MTLPPPSLLNLPRLAAAALLATLLTSCGGGDPQAPADPMVSFKQQKLDWQTCDPTLMGAGENSLTALGERAKCALVRAPQDYANLALGCASPELLEIENSLTFDRSPLNLKNAQHNARLQAKACAKNPLTKHIHTDATARDMDLVRELLGDAKLNFIGDSYGTWLGAWYASLFPERFGRMLLDSSMNVAGSFDDATLLTEMGRQRVLDDILAPYAARHPDRFNLGSSAALLTSALLALPLDIKQILANSINFSGGGIDHEMLKITAATGLQALRSGMPGAPEIDVHAAIESYVFTP